MSVKGLQQERESLGRAGRRGASPAEVVLNPSRRPWLARLAPRGFAGGRAELGLTLACLLALVVILAVELRWTRQATIGALGVLPVGVAGWLLGRRGLSTVVLGGMALRGVAFGLGMVSSLTAISQAVVLPLAGIACYLAACVTWRNWLPPALRALRRNQLCCLNICRKSRLRYRSRISFNESNRTD